MLTSWLLSPTADVYWYWARNIVGLIVFGTIVGEGVHHLPQSWLPSRFRSDGAHHIISKRSWAILAFAILLEVPIEMARDHITATAMSRLEQAYRFERVFTDEDDVQRLVSMLREFSGSQFAILVDSADRNENSEQARFGRQLAAMLVGAGWTKATNPMLQRIWAPNVNRGILIGYRFDSKYSQGVFRALVADLGAFDIQSSGDPFSDLDEHTFTFEIGVR